MLRPRGVDASDLHFDKLSRASFGTVLGLMGSLCESISILAPSEIVHKVSARELHYPMSQTPQKLPYGGIHGLPFWNSSRLCESDYRRPLAFYTGLD